MPENHQPHLIEAFDILMTDWQGKRLSLAKAIPAMMRLIKKAENAEDVASVAHGTYLLGFLYIHNSKFSHALPVIQDAFRLFQEIDYKRRMVAVLISEGEMYRFMGYLTQANTCYQRAITIADEMPPKDDESARINTMFAIGNQGHVALAHKDYKSAVSFFTEALTTLEQYYKGAADWLTTYEAVYCEYGSALAISLANKGQATAWQQLDKVHTLALKTDRPLEQAFAHRGMALTLDTPLIPPDTEWIHDSDYHFNRADHYFSLTILRYERVRTLEYHAESLQKAGKYSEAKRLLDDVIQQYTHMGLYERVKRLTQVRRTL